MKHILITGSTRGIGFAMAKAFLNKGCRVTLNGTSQDSIEAALEKLSGIYPAERFQGFVADTSIADDMDKLAASAVQEFGGIDVWINNAGVSQKKYYAWEADPQDIARIFNINVSGLIHGSITAMRLMLKQGHGQIFNMEGFGSDGMMRPTMTYYGTTKSAVRYFTRSLMLEASHTPVQVGTLSPGMVLTDFLLKNESWKPEDLEQYKKIYNILADLPDTVAPFLVKKVLAVKKNGARIFWLTPAKAFWRFLTAPLYGRNVMKKLELN